MSTQINTIEYNEMLAILHTFQAEASLATFMIVFGPATGEYLYLRFLKTGRNAVAVWATLDSNNRAHLENYLGLIQQQMKGAA